MTGVTLESLAARVESLERQLAEQKAAMKLAQNNSWRNAIGISQENEFTRSLLAEIERNSELEWQAAQAESQS
ncbi:MAG: hypothetical protein U0798_14615 [Gemmataceae bacterium]